MTLEELLSEEVGQFVSELNENYPNLSDDEFRSRVVEFIEQNKDAISLNENNRIIFDEEPLNEGLDDFDVFADETVKEPITATKKDKEISKKEIELDADGKALRSTTTTHIRGDEKTDDYRLRKRDGKEWFVVNNGKDPYQNIHKAVDRWYANCTNPSSKSFGENEKENTRLKFFDTTNVTDMAALFAFANVPNIDLSKWDVSGVETMEGMFYRSTFNSNSIEEWEPVSCVNFRNMFIGSRFAGDISGWETGTTEEFVTDPETGGYKMVAYKDPSTGEEKKERETRRVKVALPIVGARIAAEADDTDTEISSFIDDGLKLYDDDDEVEENVRPTNKHVLTLDEFVNEGLYDKIKSGVKNGVNFIKNKFKSLRIILDNFYVANINALTGKLINATDLLTTINYIQTEKPNGVSIFSNIDSDLLVNGVENKAHIIESDEKYGWIKKGSNEYQNYVDFMNMLNSDNSNSNVEISEARVGLGAEGSGLNIPNIDQEGLEQEIDDVLRMTPHDVGRDSSRALCIFGAPGIGKTTIPKTIIKKWNKNNKNKKKALIVVQCGDLELGGFNIPMPKEVDMFETIYANSKVVDRLKENGFSEDDFKNLKNVKVLRTKESPKTWLPVYYKYGTEQEVAAAQAAANGRNISSWVIDEKTGENKRVFEDTSEGGLIIFDEFLRADPELFKTISQLVQERTIGHGEYVLGEKWGIILCSNRPVDDDEVKENFDGQSPAMGNRYLSGIFNFVPDFYKWIEWAKNEGHFDEDTLNFLQGDKAIDGTANREEYEVEGEKVTAFKNWHYIDVAKFKSGESPIPTTPRGWSALMEWVYDKKNAYGYSSIFDIDFKQLRRKANGILGKEIGNAYVNHMERCKKLYVKKAKPATSAFFSGELTSGIDTREYMCKEAVKDIEKYVKSHYTRESIIEGGVEIGESFLTMAKNVDNLYLKDIIPTEIKMLHNRIVRDILQIHRSRQDKDLFLAMKPYLLYVCDENRYDVSILKEDE